MRSSLWLMLLGKGVLENRPGMVKGAAIGWVSRPPRRGSPHRQHARAAAAPRQSDHRARSHVAQLQASVATIAHQERPEYLDRLSMLRNQVFVLDHMYMSVFPRWGGSCGWHNDGRCWRRFTGAHAAYRVRGPGRC